MSDDFRGARLQCGKLAEGIGIPLDYDEQWAGTAAFLNRIGTAESNLEASQVPSYVVIQYCSYVNQIAFRC